MRRVATLALVLGWVGIADAGPTRKLTIETSPPGAVVYLGEKEAGPACEPTPCTIDAPLGETPIIIELAGHQQIFENLVVPRRGKIRVPVFRLVRAIGSIVVGGPRGAKVSIDDEPRGKAPVTVEVSAEGHHVVVTLRGKTLYDDFVEVDSGGEVTIPVKGAGASRHRNDDADDAGADDDADDEASAFTRRGDDAAEGDAEADGDADEDTDADDDEDILGEDRDDDRAGTLSAAAAPARARAAYLRASAAIDVGFRHFVYEGVETPQQLREQTESGALLGGPIIELWPGEIAGVRLLRGLSVLARLQFGLNPQRVAGNGIMNPTNTFWQSMELSVRHRWIVRNMVTLEVGGGYVRDQFQFEGTANDLLLLPDADYQSFRLGGRASLLLGRLEPYLAAETRLVTAGGRLAVRFREASASGLRGALGLGARHGKLFGRVEAAATSYRWDFTFESADERRADGASDSIKQLQLVVGYEY